MKRCLACRKIVWRRADQAYGALRGSETKAIALSSQWSWIDDAVRDAGCFHRTCLTLLEAAGQADEYRMTESRLRYEALLGPSLTQLYRERFS